MTFQTTVRILLSTLSCLAAGFGRANAQDPIDVVLVLDNSGSMRSNDPDRLMPTAVASFAGQLPVGSRTAVVVFDSRVRLATDLTPIDDPAFRASFDQALGALDYAGARSDIPGAVERATYTLRVQARRGSRRALVLFTDGIVDVGDAARDGARRAWLYTRVTKDAVAERIAIFGIGFTESADFQLIQTLSRDTDGAHFRIERASAIRPVFREIASKLTDRSPHVGAPQPQAEVARASTTRTFAGASFIVAALAGLGFWIGSARRAPIPIRATLTRVSSIPEVLTIDRRVVHIGRQPKVRFRRNDLVIDDPRVSKRHAQIEFRRGQFYVRDNGSRNGTFVSAADGTLFRLEPGERTAIYKGSRVVFHGHEYIFDCALPRGSARIPADETEMAAPIVAATCNLCRREVDREGLSSWHRFDVCLSCREEIDQLSSHEAVALERQVERELRDAVTQRM